MARLIHLSEFNHRGLDPRFYFPDSRWDGTVATVMSFIPSSLGSP